MADKKREYTNLSAGDATPYWYEWYVGLSYVIDLISPDTKIKSVIFQSSETQKLDDVVILYKDGIKECIQVKNTRENNKLGFETFIKVLMPAFQKEWKELKRKHGETVKVQLFSNKGSSGEWYGTKKTGIYKRPQLDKFWLYVHEKSRIVKSIEEIKMDPKDDWEKAWKKCLAGLKELKNSKEDLRLEFLQSFDIRLGQENLFPLENKIVMSIVDKYHITNEQAKKVFEAMIAELPKWTTKDGKKHSTEEVTHEAVIKALFLRGNEQCSNHHIPVTANFFESRKGFINNLIKGLKETQKKVVFLSGEPNVGKTTIISYLYNGYSNIVDFRFYAFKPLIPGQTFIGADKGNSSHRGLWGDLFIQIFDFVRNNFSDYSNFRIIPYIDWMDDIKLQTETLRLLGEISKKLRRKVIVAIDGIDHAARSKDKENFLNKFCGPESIPQDVVFLIAGQPISGYINEYPKWLIDKDIVEHYQVPEIVEEDIAQLYDSSNINKNSLTKDLVISIVNEVSKGNTLSAVFAIREAETCLNIEELEKRLLSKKLNDGIDNYYETIWNHCIDNINTPVKESMEIKLACVLSFSISKISSDILTDIFNEVSFTNEDWKFILRKLAPLIREYDDGFIIDINDVRVFLKKRINCIYNKEAVNNVKLALAKYYLNTKKYISERHEVVFELLKDTEYGYILAEKLNVEFMMEAIIINQPLIEIRKQLDFVIICAINTRRWDLLINIFCAIRTFEQFEKTLEWSGETYKGNRKLFYLYKSEIMNESEIVYSYSILTEIIEDALEIHKLKDINRSKRIINAHFNNKSFTEIVKLFVGEDNKNFSLNDSRKDLVCKFGKICRYCEFLLNIDKDIKDLDKYDLLFMEFYLKGWFEASTDFENVDIEKTIPEHFIIPTGEVFFKFLDVLARENYWTYLFKVTDNIVISNFNKPIILQIGVWYILHSKRELFIPIQDIVLKDAFKYLAGVKWDPEYPTEYKLRAYCNLFFTLGYNKKECLCIDDVANEYYLHLDDSEKELLKLILRTNYKIGYYLHPESDRNSFYTEYKVILESILSWEKRHTNNISISEFIRDILLKMISLSEEYESCSFQGIAFQIFKQRILALNNEGIWDYSVSPILISFLQKRGEKKTILTYLKSVSDTQGQIWRLGVDERRYIIKDIFKCCRNVLMDDQYLNYIKEWDEWFGVGYSGHKEYILFDLLEWLTLLFKHEPKKWKVYFNKTIQISNIVNKFADNRIGLNFYVIFATAAIKESIQSLGDIFNSITINRKDKIFVLSRFLQKLLMDNSIELENSVILWNFICQNLLYGDYADKEEMSNLKDSIIDYLNRNNCPTEKLESYLEINKVRDDYKLTKTIERKQEQVHEADEENLVNLEKLFDSGKTIWDDCCSFLKQLEDNRPKNTSEYVSRIINLLIRRKETYEWRGDGVFDVYRAIFPLIDEETEWFILEKNIENSSNQNSFSRWAYLIGDIILNVCLLHAESSSLEEIEHMVTAIIDMHVRFISGNYRYDYINDNILVAGKKMDTWEDLIRELN